ncbi:uncharacterized protein LOC105431723 [Pogonomyrmex barbatus]|uniref:Uncharacterized protein LOC105431723 n=1 Tax=Pogonomyrmex barbatus TaxID=144034 RepID=A0A6I9WQN2_9HYME|nr:uncharacterized protein LOC105431723 [Pogonomyrmex barbatus]
MFALRGLLVIALACSFATAMPPARAVYDQRQSGDLNVQIELKDLQVLAMLNSDFLNDYTDYDYFYDYSDFTIKPGNKPTTSSATGTTEKIAQISEPLTSIMSANNVSLAANDTTLSKDEETPNVNPSSDSTSSTPNADNDNDKNQPNVEKNESSPETTPFIAPSSTVKSIYALRSQKRCRSGYIPNGDGRCRRASRPWLSLLP